MEFKNFLKQNNKPEKPNRKNWFKNLALTGSLTFLSLFKTGDIKANTNTTQDKFNPNTVASADLEAINPDNGEYEQLNFGENIEGGNNPENMLNLEDDYIIQASYIYQKGENKVNLKTIVGLEDKDENDKYFSKVFTKFFKIDFNPEETLDNLSIQRIATGIYGKNETRTYEITLILKNTEGAEKIEKRFFNLHIGSEDFIKNIINANPYTPDSIDNNTPKKQIAFSEIILNNPNQ